MVLIPIILVALIGLSWLVASGHTQSADVAILTYIHDHSSAPAELLFSTSTNLGDPLFLVPLGLVLSAVLLHRQSYRKAILVALLFAGSGLATSLLKTVFDRARPDLWQHNTIETTFSYPSGHATACMIIALTVAYLAWNHPRLRKTLFVLLPIYVLIVSFSRLYLGVHYPTDIIGGWLVAGLWLLIVIWLARSRIVNNLR